MSATFFAARCRGGFLLALLLCLAFTLQWSLKAGHWDVYFFEAPAESLGELVLETIPVQVRHLAADFLWLRADEYMHYGPSRRRAQAFMAGSYAGNTEIVPLLELAIRLNPRHFDAYAILSQNLAFYLDRFTDGIRLLQAGIRANRDHPRVHELFGTIAYCYGFVHGYGGRMRNDRVVSLKYLDRAVEAFARAHLTASDTDQVLNLRNYQVLRARFLVEQGRRDEALQAWRAAGLGLGLGDGLLPEYLRRVADGEPVPDLPEDLLQDAAVASAIGYRPIALGGDPEGPGVRHDSAAAAVGTDSHRHEDGCDHDAGQCRHQEAASPLLDQAMALRWVLAQMLLLGSLGATILLRSQFR